MDSMESRIRRAMEQSAAAETEALLASLRCKPTESGRGSVAAPGHWRPPISTEAPASCGDKADAQGDVTLPRKRAGDDLDKLV